MQGAEIDGKVAYLKYVTKPVLRQVQQPSKVTWLPGEVEAQQLVTCETPPFVVFGLISKSKEVMLKSIIRKSNPLAIFKWNVIVIVK